MAIKIIFKLVFCFVFLSCSSSSTLSDRIEILEKMNTVSKYKPIKTFTRKELENIEYPMIEIQTNGILKQALMIPLSTRNNYYNYSSGSGQLITLNGSIVSKTNGINIDLVSVEVDKGSPLINSFDPIKWPKKGYRKHSYLNHLNQLENKLFNCKFEKLDNEKIIIVEIEFDLKKFTETCSGNGNSFINTYWVDNSGFIWKSEQWINNNVKAIISIIKSAQMY